MAEKTRAAAAAKQERAAASGRITVEATKVGYYGDVRRRVGDVFTITEASHFSEKWMRRVSGGKLETPTQARRREHAAIAEAAKPPKAPTGAGETVPTGAAKVLGE